MGRLVVLLGLRAARRVVRCPPWALLRRRLPLLLLLLIPLLLLWRQLWGLLGWEARRLLCGPL